MNNFKESKKKLKISGFTLVETLVAISILSLSIIATFAAVQNGIKSSTVAKDQTIAFYLAQEGMEFIKNIRDENALHSINGVSTNWLASMSSLASDPCYFGKTCTVDSGLKIMTTCSEPFGTCPVLNQDPATGLYGYTSSWTPTNFRRDLQFIQVSADEITVHMYIYWASRGTTKSLEIVQSFFNRQ
ncbi:prepilin-type N-terminal cleavage/methylation domain-containing protein [Patescibacteria group bacterium]|nr:prepilin-type N-terminal cleavage/methylation domain-containing protein [Patescibacteria group bacterium]